MTSQEGLLTEYTSRILDLLVADSGGRDALRPGLVSLVSSMFTTSTQSEEGVFPSFTIALPLGEDEPDVTCRFEDLIPLDSQSLRKLSPTFGRRPWALFVHLATGTPRALGIGLVTESIFDPRAVPQSQMIFDGITLTIEAPGVIIASSGTLSVELRDLKIGVLMGLESCSAVGTWASELWLQARGSFVAREWGPVAPRPDAFVRLAHRVWGEVLRRAAEYRHGGAFLVLPKIHSKLEQQNLHSEFGLNVGTRTRGPNILNALLGFLMPGSNASGAIQANGPRDRLRECIQSVSRLALVDGTVVLSNDLHVMGFGAMIDDLKGANDASVTKRMPWVATSDGEAQPIEAFGARHRSALSFCAHHKNSLAFVISQDGPVHVFTCSDTLGLSSWGPIAESKSQQFL